MTFFDKLPLPSLIIIAFLFFIAPISPEPHLFEKTRMLFNGTLIRPIDIFDLFLHATPTILLILKIYRTIKQKK